MDLNFYKQKASYVRLRALEDAVRAGQGHLGGSFSCVELLVGLYYKKFLRINPNDPLNPCRDFLFIGKGHACIALYPILYDLGFITKDRYLSYGIYGNGLGGQLDKTIPGIENNTGSLGHALGMAAGVALASKIDKKNNRSIALIGDAECDEGSIWEAIMFAAEHKLNNLVCIIDRNRLSVTQIMDTTVLFSNFKKKIEMFDWNCHVIDGHSFEEIFKTFNEIKNSKKPTFILAETIKGKGISFMEGITKWHHAIPTQKEIEIARKELNAEGFE